MEKPALSRDLGAGFRQYFEIVPATTDALRKDVYSIRHEVYCEELGYEALNADRIERDEYDAQSLHCLMRASSEEKTLVGCSRLILTRPEDPSFPLPFERTCEDVIDRTIVDPSKLPRESIAEVSRLAVRSRYRRRKGEERGAIEIDLDSSTRFPYIPMGLYLGNVVLCNRNGIETAFLITERRLSEHFSKIGFRIQQIGAPIEHRGERVPSMIDVNRLVREMRSLLAPLYREVSSQIDRMLDQQVVHS